jgi:hypothetical protein
MPVRPWILASGHSAKPVRPDTAWILDSRRSRPAVCDGPWTLGPVVSLIGIDVQSPPGLSPISRLVVVTNSSHPDVVFNPFGRLVVVTFSPHPAVDALRAIVSRLLQL